MRVLFFIRSLPTRRLMSIILFAFTFAISSAAQNRSYLDTDYPQTTRAEQEADRLVSLSPEKIIALLQQETGLLLQVKKLLVRKAYEQGRLLDPVDLTDESLFRLITRDENIRIVITREIEDRGYIQVKPTKDEIRREQQKAANQAAASNETPAEAGKSQEQTYWAQHERDLRNSNQNGTPAAAPQMNVPQQQQPLPQPPPAYDQRRAIERAQAQYDGGDYPTGLPFDAMGMQKISPDQLSGLMAARMSNASMTGSEDSGRVGSGLSAFGGSAGNPFANSGLGVATSPGMQAPLADPYSNFGNTTQFPQDARLDMRPRYMPAPYKDRGPLQPALKRRPNPYADVPSLYDLYSQYSRRSPVLERFGIDVFESGTGNFEELPMDMPVGPDYVIGPGDGLNIDLWGGVSQRLRRVVDREGRLLLPEIGGVQVVGKTLGDVQHIVQLALRTQFRDVQADISLSKLRTVRVYVVGDVQRPGAYDISSLSTPLNAVYQAGGPTSRGSLRLLKQYRGKELVQEVDVYYLLLHGVRSGMQRLEAGDTILVPPLGPIVTIEGMVSRPAIYELRGEANLASALELAGGVLPSGTLRHIDVERLLAHESRTMLALDIPENNNQEAVSKALEEFKVQDGDKVKISPIVAFADKTVYLDGHVFRPGKYAYREGMKVSDLVKSYKDVLPEPYKRHAEVIRLKSPDYTPEVLAFNLEDALAGKEQNLELKPFDTVRIFGRYDFEDQPIITVSGEVRDPGDHVTNGATYLRDAVYLAGNTTPEARIDDVQVFRRTEEGKLKVISVNLRKALAGDDTQNILLEPKDRVFIHRNLAKTDPAAVSIEGEVARPGKYPLGDNMSAADLVRLAGGFKRSAYTEAADLTRYDVEEGSRMVGEHVSVPIAKAMANEPDSDVRLRDGDVLTIRQLAGWNDVGSTIAVRGEVVHPGTYGIQEGERLSSILERAGGLRSDAYAYGAIFQRAQVRDLEEKNRSQLVRQIQEEGATLKTVAEVDPVTKEAAMLQWKSTLEKLQNTPPPGRMVIHISGDFKKWANTPADIQVRAGDIIYIPKKPNFVMVDGAVYNATAITYKPGKSANWYLHQAGGFTSMANKKASFVIRADGSVVGGSGGMFSGGALDAALSPGDMLVVPDRAFGGGINWRNTLQVAQLVSAVGIAVQVARGF